MHRTESASQQASSHSPLTRHNLLKTIRTVQKLLGHANVNFIANTAMIYTHVLNRGGRGVKSPIDA